MASESSLGITGFRHRAVGHVYTATAWQQIIAAVLAIYFNANLPIAVTLVWITNPLTWAPMYYFAYKIGAIVMGQTAFSFDKFSELFTVEKRWSWGLRFW